MRYYFHVRTDDTLLPDLEGAEFDSLEAARAEAEQAAREILAERLLRNEPLHADVFELTNEKGEILERVSFQSVLRLKT